MRHLIIGLLVLAGAAGAAWAQENSPLKPARDTNGFLTTEATAATAPTTSARANEPAAATTAGGTHALDDKHKLRPGDKLSFQIIEDREAPKSLVVTDSGELDVPYVGRVLVTDKTCRQLAAELKAQLEQEYYHRATVVLGVDAVSKVRGRVYIWGQVRNQGPVEIPVGEVFTAGKAILKAGGFGDFANKKKVRVVRGGSAGSSDGKQTFELDMVDILENGRTEKDMALEPDDFIIVSSRAINF